LFFLFSFFLGFLIEQAGGQASTGKERVMVFIFIFFNLFFYQYF
jgi:fructose-1,6-bisphosphatase